MPDTTRDDIEAAFAEVEAADSKPDGKSDPKPVTEPAKDPAKEPPADRQEPQKPAAPAAKEPAKEPAKDADKKPDADADKKPKWSYRDPPARWSAEAKDAWVKAFGDLDPENPTHKQIGTLRDMMFARNDEMEQLVATRTQELEGRVREFEPINKVLAPYVPRMKAAGHDPAKALDDLLKLNDYAMQNPAQFIKWFSEQHKVDLKQFTQPAAPTIDPDDPLDIIPQKYRDAMGQVPRLEQQIQQLSQQLAQQGQQWQQFQGSTQQREVDQARTQLRAWATETDEAGNLKRPFYADNAIRQEMTRLMEAGLETELDKAYDRAVWSNPTTRQQALDSQKARERAEIERKAREEAARKRRAAGSLGVSSGTVPPAAPGSGSGGDSIRELLESGYAEMAAG